MILPLAAVLYLQMRIKRAYHGWRFPYSRSQLLRQVEAAHGTAAARAYSKGVIDGYYRPVTTGITNDHTRWMYFCGAQDGARLREGVIEFDQIPSRA